MFHSARHQLARRRVPKKRATLRHERSALPQMPRVLPRPHNGSTACLRLGPPCMNTNGADSRSCRLTPAERQSGENAVEARTTDDAVGSQTTNAWRTRKNGEDRECRIWTVHHR